MGKSPEKGMNLVMEGALSALLPDMLESRSIKFITNTLIFMGVNNGRLFKKRKLTQIDYTVKLVILI